MRTALVVALLVLLLVAGCEMLFWPDGHVQRVRVVRDSTAVRDTVR